jgi:hypothetical protein
VSIKEAGKRCSHQADDAKTSESTIVIRTAKIVRMLQKKGVTQLVQLEMGAPVMNEAKD